VKRRRVTAYAKPRQREAEEQAAPAQIGPRSMSDSLQPPADTRNRRGDLCRVEAASRAVAQGAALARATWGVGGVVD